MVEFALMAPIFLGTLFLTLNGGVLLFSRNSVDHASLAGLDILSAEGTYYQSATVNADSVAIATMNTSGMGPGIFVNVTEVDIYRVLRDSNGNLSQDATAINRYRRDGTAIGAIPWPASGRNVTGDNADYIGIDIKYSYQVFGRSGAALAFTDRHWTRLEPQTLGIASTTAQGPETA